MLACRQRDVFLDDLDAEEPEAILADVVGKELRRCISIDISWLAGGPPGLQQALQALETLVPAADEVDLSEDGQQASHGLVQAPGCCLSEQELATLGQAVLDLLKYHIDADFSTQAEASTDPELVWLLLLRS